MKKVKHLSEEEMKKAEIVIFALESKLPPNHPVRRQMFRARVEFGAAMMMNRKDKDFPQEEVE